MSKQNSVLLELRTGCRLHFGLMELAANAPCRYAGLGVMLSEPSMHLRISKPTTDATFAPFLGPASPMTQLICQISTGETQLVDSAERLPLGNEYRNRIATWVSRVRLDCSIEVLQGYPFHCGLGSGTQLASLLAALQILVPQDLGLAGNWQSVKMLFKDCDYHRLAELSGRGLRSGIGLFGFLNGGLIWDRGYEAGTNCRSSEALSRVAMPEQWRFVLLRPQDSSGVSGQRENFLINSLSRQNLASRQRMCQLADQICQAAICGAYEEFCHLLEEYLYLAACLFMPAQGGLYNGPQATLAAQCAKDFGLRAVGQSSWGPTVFGLASSPHHAEQIAQQIQAKFENWDIQVSSVTNAGAQMRMMHSHG